MSPRPLRAAGSVLLATAALVLGCGGGNDDGPEAVEEQPTPADTTEATGEEATGGEATGDAPGPVAGGTAARLEATILEAVNRGPARPDQPAVEEVDCPRAVDLEAIGEEYRCELSGGGEQGGLDVLVVDRGRISYQGGFAGVGEFAQGITVEGEGRGAGE